MVTDIELTESQDVRLDDTNDLATVSGEDTIHQSVAIHALDAAHELVGGPLTPRLVNRLRSDVRTALQRDPQVASVQTVEVTGVGNDSVTLSVLVNKDETFEITLP